jgi:hypothetical protein
MSFILSSIILRGFAAAGFFKGQDLMDWRNKPGTSKSKEKEIMIKK